VVEVDGWSYHRTRAAFERDRRRDGRLLVAGYRVLRITWRQLTRERERVIARLAAVLRPDGPRPSGRG
jgi:very-short-patch-repair endonuclease